MNLMSLMKMSIGNVVNVEEDANMKQSEFNKKYKEYLEPRYPGCELINEEIIDHLDTEFQELIKIPGFKFKQVKTKFHFFRLYCVNVPQEKIEEIENKLYYIQMEIH